MIEIHYKRDALAPHWEVLTFLSLAAAQLVYDGLVAEGCFMLATRPA